MDDKATKRGGGAVVALVLVVVLVLLPMVYVLSIGQVVRLANDGISDEKWFPVFGVIYWPRNGTSGNVRGVGPFLNWSGDWGAPNSAPGPVPPPLRAAPARPPAAPRGTVPATASPE